MKRIYSEVANNNYDDVCNYYTIDAWKTDDDNEEGKVVAVINATTADVWYIDGTARLDQLVDYAIKERVNAIKAKMAEKDLIITKQKDMIERLNRIIQSQNIVQNVLLKWLKH